MENSNPRKPVRNGTTWTIPGNQLVRDARQRGDVVVESYSSGSPSTIVIAVQNANQVHSEPPQTSSGWTSVVIETGPDHWMNLVVNNVDVLIEALQRAKRQ
jgi:hypothetical protein